MAKLKRHEIPENDSINMTPMMDVIFQLLVFFVLSSSITKPTQIELQLPDSTSGVKSANEERLVITYRMKDAQPEITLNSQVMASLDKLGEALKQMSGPAAIQPVDIQIDKAIPYQDVVAVMDAVRDAGFPKFSLLTLAKSRTGNP
jgi:biopolymer transport protein ExbD